MAKHYYQILDVGVSIESDSTEFLDLFDDDYSWFKVSSINGHGIFDRRLECSINLHGDEKDQFLTINNKVHPLNGHPGKYSYIYGAIVNSLTEEVRDYLMIHAGVVAKEGNGVIIAGPCGVGKSTLVLKLVDSGFDFFSDEYCPIHRKTGLIHPFLRSVWTTPDIQSVLNSSTFTPESHVGKVALRDKKALIKIDDMNSFIADKPCAPRSLICVDPGNNQMDIYYLYLYIKGCEKEILNDLRGLKGVNVERADDKYSKWRIKCPRDRNITEKIKEIFRKYEQHIWEVCQLNPVKPDYNREPVLKQITNHEALFFLLSDLKQKPISKPEGNTAETSPGMFFMESCAMLDEVACYRLSIGRLDAMRDLVINLGE